MEWVNAHKGSPEKIGREKIVIIDDYTNQKDLDKSEFVENLFVREREFGLTFLFLHKFDDAPPKIRDSATGFINFPAESDQVNKDRALHKATGILDGKPHLYVEIVKKFALKSEYIPYISLKRISTIIE